LYKFFDKQLQSVIEEKFDENSNIGFNQFKVIVSNVTHFTNYEEKIVKIFKIFDRKGEGKVIGKNVRRILRRYDLLNEEERK